MQVLKQMVEIRNEVGVLEIISHVHMHVHNMYLYMYIIRCTYMCMYVYPACTCT